MDSSETTNIPAQVQCSRCEKVYPAGSGWICPDDNGELQPIGPDPLIGTLFDRKYEVLSILGKGGMSIVYKAKHKYMDRVVAIKLLREHLVNDQTARLRFEQESKAASALAHQNVVSVYDFGITPNGQAYFVMDCLEGESLADLLEREGTLDIHRSIDVFKQVCDGLEPAHKLGLVHRDLKPSNIVMLKHDDGSDLIKIVDFGIAKFLPRQDDPGQQKLTQTGEVFGSPLYMSPEQCQGQMIDARSDIYSLGCLMFEALIGSPPFVGDSFFTIAARHINGETPSFNQRAPEVDIPPAIEEVVDKCMAKDPADRFQSVADIRQALLDAALFSGLRNVRAGGVPVANQHSPQALTWDKLVFPFGNTIKGQRRGKPSLALFLFAGIPTVILGASAAFLFLWQGPADDRGTPFSKIVWQVDMGLGQQAMERGNYDEARERFLSAKKLAAGFGDTDARLRTTLEQLGKVYGLSNKYQDQEKTTKEIIELTMKRLRLEYKANVDRLAALQPSTTSGVQATMTQLEAQASAGLVILCANKLYAAHMYREEEDLLNKAINTFNRLNIEHETQVADFMMAKAACILAEQRLSEVRPLLKQAQTLYENNFNKKNPQPDLQMKLLRSYLKLGQFDRDQSDFAESKTELTTAIKMAETSFPKEYRLMLECWNSYADLMRQLKNTPDYEQAMAKVHHFERLSNNDRSDDADDKITN